MRLSILLTIVGVLQANAHGLSQVFTISGKKVTIKEVVSQIEKTSNFKFLYQDEVIDSAEKVDIEVYKQPIENVLGHLLANSNLGFKRFDDNLIVLTRNTSAYLQEITVKGTITSALNGDPLPGVSIVVKGTTRGTISDNDGQYSIDVPSASSVLLVSSIGFLSEEIPVEGRSTLDITLTESIEKLEEVVVVGYGTTKRSDLTGNISSVKSNDIRNLSAHSVAEALQGKVAGVIVAKEGGNPGRESQLNINGVSSINGTPPLWVVDGVPSGTGNNFNIKDIESIEILKDGSSAAIYGAAAAGGVILVTTKRGRGNEKVKVDLNSSWGVNSPIGLPDLLKKTEFIEYKKVALTNADPSNSQPYDVNWNNPDFVSKLPDSDWKNSIFDGSGLEQQYNIAISGGGKTSNYYVSGNYLDQDGTYILNYFKRYTFRANSDFRIGKRIRVGESLFFSRTDYKAPQDEPSIMNSIFRASPLDLIYDPTNIRGNGWGRSSGGGGNPVGFQHVVSKETWNNSFNGNIYGEVDLLKGLTFKAILSAGIGNEHYEQRDLPYDFGGLRKDDATMVRRINTGMSMQSTITLNYDVTFGKHNFKLLAGYEANKGDRYNVGVTGVGFKVPDPSSFALITNSSGLIVNGGDNNYDIYGRTISMIGRVNYSFASKYLLTFNIRRDGKSEFGPNKRFGTFPGISAAWRLSEEPFIKNNVAFITNLKIRAGYSTLGNTAGVGEFGYQNSYQTNGSNTYTFANSSGTYVNGINVVRFPNEDIHWEVVKQTDLGFDFGLFQNKLEGSFSYYIKKTTDMIYSVPVSYMAAIGTPNSGGQTVNTNIGAMENKGVNFSLSYTERRGDFSYGADFVLGAYKNQLTKLDLPTSVIDRGGFGIDGMPGGINRTEVGQPLGQFYGYVVEGIWQNQAEIDAANADAPNEEKQYQRNTSSQPQPGDFKFKDLNGDGQVNDKDRTYLGNPWPKLTYGLRVHAEYKGIDVSMFWDGVGGQDVFDATIPIYQGFFNDYNSTGDIAGYWDAQTNPNSSKPRLVNGDPTGNYKTISSYMVKNGSYLKLRNLQIGYTLPENISSKIGLTRARVFLNAQNLLTFSKYHRDPELGGNVLYRNIDNVTRYPQNRYLGGGLEISF